MILLYFTATGNSLSVAKKIGGELLSIPQMIKEGRYKFEDDVIGVIAPTYGFNTPNIVSEFLNKAEFKADYKFAISTYGNMGGGVSKRMRTLGEVSNINFDYTNELLMVDNFLPLFEMDKQIEDIPKKKIDENLKIIIEDINNRKRLPIVKENLKDKAIYKVVKFAEKFQGEVGDTAKKFKFDENCSLCGTCMRVCPVNNIKVTDKVEFGSNCESCFSCVHNCIHNAIHIKNEKSAKRFRNEDVKLREIIASNSQL